MNEDNLINQKENSDIPSQTNENNQKEEIKFDDGLTEEEFNHELALKVAKQNKMIKDIIKKYKGS